MSLIKIDENGKGNICCSKSIDLEIGCRSGCVGCYGFYTSMMGKAYFDCIKGKEFNEKKFRSSCKSTFGKEFKNIRVGKHSDPGASNVREILKSVLKIAGEEGLKLILVSKSLEYDKEVSDLMAKYGHILHISLGMITNAPSDLQRINVYNQFRTEVKSFLRIIEDVTKNVPDLYKNLPKDKCIITPMRYKSKNIASVYSVDLKSYKFNGGYYRPLFKHESWSQFPSWCGEVGDIIGCCKCGIE